MSAIPMNQLTEALHSVGANVPFPIEANPDETIALEKAIGILEGEKIKTVQQIREEADARVFAITKLYNEKITSLGQTESSQTPKEVSPLSGFCRIFRNAIVETFGRPMVLSLVQNKEAVEAFQKAGISFPENTEALSLEEMTSLLEKIGKKCTEDTSDAEILKKLRDDAYVDSLYPTTLIETINKVLNAPEVKEAFSKAGIILPSAITKANVEQFIQEMDRHESYAHSVLKASALLNTLAEEVFKSYSKGTDSKS